MAPTVQEVAQKLWDLAEVSLLETKSSAYLKDLLKKNGFKITSEATANVPHGLHCRIRQGRAKAGYPAGVWTLCPDWATSRFLRSNHARTGARPDTAVGHNLIGAGAMGASLAIKNLMEEKSIPGTLCVYGTAAEESEGAKVFMAREGVFDDVDAMLHWHPMAWARVANLRTAAAPTHVYRIQGKSGPTLACIRGKAAARWTQRRYLPTA